jgi:malic enzyme
MPSSGVSESSEWTRALKTRVGDAAGLEAREPLQRRELVLLGLVGEGELILLREARCLLALLARQGIEQLVAAAGVGPNLVKKSEIAQMNRHSIAFLLANPVPEMWPDDAKAAGAEIVATGRSDFPNQVNNSLLFPSIFRGALDVRAKTISDGMVIAAARELAQFAKDKGLTRNRIMPTMVDWEVYPRVAAALGSEAVKEGLAKKKASRKHLLETATETIAHSRKTMKTLMRSGIIVEPPK